jgi:hypothetical protein
MTRRTVHIQRLVLRGTAVDPRHGERLRGLVEHELERLLDGATSAGALGRVPADSVPEQLASPMAREIAAKLPGETSR